MEMNFEKFFAKYHIQIKDLKQMQTALTHTSYANEHHLESYERLEFLGDAVLELFVYTSINIFKFQLLYGIICQQVNIFI